MCNGWGEYAVKKTDEIIILDDETELKNAVDAFINPLTALCLRKLILSHERKTCVIDDASSHLGRTLIQLCRDADIEVIPVVRDDKTVQEFKDKYSLKNVMNQNTEDFDNRLRDIVHNAKPTVVYISCVGGDLASRIFKATPPKSHFILVGNLSEKDLVLPAQALFLEGKMIRGFSLERFIREVRIFY